MSAVQRVDDLFTVLEVLAAAVGRIDGPGGPFKESHTELALQGADQFGRSYADTVERRRDRRRQLRAVGVPARDGHLEDPSLPVLDQPAAARLTEWRSARSHT